MNIVFIGSGNVATHLAISLKALGHSIKNIYSQTIENAETLSAKVDAEPTVKLSEIDLDADIYIFSVKDDVLHSLIDDMPHTKGIWVHTAGSVPMNLFSYRTKKYGVIYPLQTFSKDREISLSDVPLFIDGSNPETTCFIEEIANSLSSNVIHIDGEKRAVLHLAAVFACNFTNHMYTLAQDIIENEKLSFDVLKPLIMETAFKVMDMPPVKAQTGPAVRLDHKIMQSHLDKIKSPEIKQLYKLLSQSIHSYTQ